MRPTVIYIPELRKIFTRISHAARAVGADASNVGKVLRGQRKTAGGYHFEFRWAREEGRGKAILELQKTIRRANELIAAGKLRRRFGFSAELQALDSWRDDIGTVLKKVTVTNKKTGEPVKIMIEAIASGSKNFVADSVPDIISMNKKMNLFIEHAKKAEKKLDDDIKNLADMLGLSFREAIEYDNIFPEFYRMLKLANQDQRLGTNEMLEIEIAVTNAGASEAQVEEMFNRMKHFFADPSLPRSYFDEIVADVYRDLGIGDEFGNEDLF